MALDVLMYEPTVYTVAEVAGFLRCSTRTIFNLIDREELACLKVGGLTRITARKLDAYLVAHAVPADDHQ